MHMTCVSGPHSLVSRMHGRHRRWTRGYDGVKTSEQFIRGDVTFFIHNANSSLFTGIELKRTDRTRAHANTQPFM